MPCLARLDRVLSLEMPTGGVTLSQEANKKALVLLAPGFEEIEAITVIDVLRRAGIAVTVAGTVAGLIAGSVEGAHAIRVGVDGSVEALSGENFDLIFLPGGQPGTKNLKADPHVTRILKEATAAKRYVAAICAAPSILADAGYLSGRRATSHGSVRSIMERADAVQYRGRDAVVIDGPFITSRSPGTAMECAIALVEVLCGPQKATTVHADILAPG
jgi:4-methyl-5(b-hydroxyethyl)-thiazole monophosphate biosynthesis